MLENRMHQFPASKRVLSRHAIIIEFLIAPKARLSQIGADGRQPHSFVIAANKAPVNYWDRDPLMRQKHKAAVSLGAC